MGLTIKNAFSPLTRKQGSLKTMTLLQKILTASAVIISALTLPSTAQVKLPSSHNAQHSELLASQKPIGNEISAINYALFNELSDREGFEDDEIYAQYWESQLVNPYGNIAIPLTKELNVASFVPPITGRVTSNYGYRRSFRRVHKGIDLALHVGDTVRAAFDGKIRICKYERRGYGYYVVIRHDNGMETVYGHLSKFIVKPNQRVKAGDPIALGGNTGRSTGPHLHFETRYLGIAINPAAIIDFENFVPHKDIFTFDKKTHALPQKYSPKKSKKSYASKKRKKKAKTKRK